MSDEHRDLDEWVEHFHRLYYPTQNRERPTVAMFAHLVEVFASFNKSIFRKKDIELATKDLSKIFGWYCALWDELGLGSLQEAVFLKFPNQCLYCGRRPCRCGPNTERLSLTLDRMRLLYEEGSGSIPTSLHGWTTHFRGIYPVVKLKNHSKIEAEMRKVMSRLLEELGEVSEAVRFRRIEPLEVRLEMADVFAWTCKAYNYLPIVFPDDEIPSFDTLVADRYPDVCRKCHHAPCHCWEAVRRNLVTVVQT